jgi:hypothetical protein
MNGLMQPTERGAIGLKCYRIDTSTRVVKRRIELEENFVAQNFVNISLVSDAIAI